MSTDTRRFHLGDILSVTTGRLVSPGHIQAVHELLDFMTGDTLFTHQLPRAGNECGPALLEQYPALKDVVVPDRFDGEPHIWRWLAEQVDRFGMELPVKPLAPGDHTRIDPIAELTMMRPDMPIVTIKVPGSGERS